MLAWGVVTQSGPHCHQLGNGNCACVSARRTESGASLTDRGCPLWIVHSSFVDAGSAVNVKVSGLVVEPACLAAGNRAPGAQYVMDHAQPCIFRSGSLGAVRKVPTPPSRPQRPLALARLRLWEDLRQGLSSRPGVPVTGYVGVSGWKRPSAILSGS
jgi:hypothetical protein